MLDEIPGPYAAAPAPMEMVMLPPPPPSEEAEGVENCMEERCGSDCEESALEAVAEWHMTAICGPSLTR